MNNIDGEYNNERPDPSALDPARYTELQRGLDVIGFDAGTDRLFSVGEMVDHGPESHHALRRLDQLGYFPQAMTLRAEPGCAA